MTTGIHQTKLSRRAALAAAGTLGALGLTVASGVAGNAAPGTKVPKPTLAFRPDGGFKVVQFNDTQDDEQTDRRTIELMDKTLDAEKPDFVVINGDVINGGCDSELEVKQALNHVVQPMESRKIPWAVTFGNHDEDSVARTGMTEARMLRTPSTDRTSRATPTGTGYAWTRSPGTATRPLLRSRSTARRSRPSCGAI
ncbi:metallophosphoesterase [Arthrobacter sp. 754]|uniref:metallophosphoesterase n=1 Tax=Arthrobacter sp. 754 TaxID=3156315 RepID=UPI003394405A